MSIAKHFNFNKVRHNYTVYTDKSTTAKLGDIAHTQDEYFVFGVDGWVVAPPGFVHPKLGPNIVFVSGVWKSSRQWYNIRNSAVEAPAQTIIQPTPVVLPDNQWVTTLLERWNNPPLSYYTPVAPTVQEILGRLARWPTRLKHFQTSPYKSTNSGLSPSTSLVISDLLFLGHDLVQYTDLRCGTEVPMESISRVFTRMLESQLQAPLVQGRVIALLNIAATENGILRCMFDLPGMVQHLGPQFAFHDMDHYFDQDELKKLYPPPRQEPIKFPGNASKASLISARDAEIAKRTEYLRERMKEIFLSSIWTPGGWFTDTHIDGNGSSQLLIHCEGEKLWLLWPPSKKNLDWWGTIHPGTLWGEAPLTCSALDNLEELQVLHVTEPCAFILPPFTIHSVIAFSTSTHTGAIFHHSAHWPLAHVGLEFLEKLVKNPRFGEAKSKAAIEDVLKHEKYWIQVMGEESAAANYLAEWKAKTADILAYIAAQEISTV
ncbi:hypothetical protein B0H12DRAFT_1229394 [Mycena haematopus]|nr:hypothetical protein B0H12DRAFT_1229394 [Mycena haematopus]